MQIFLFHWMSWPNLPDDFSEKYGSAFLTIPNKLFDPELGSQLFNEWLDAMEYAEELGFDGVSYNEHHQMAHAPIPACNILSAALARRTTTLKLAPVGHVLPTYHPIQLAEEIAMVDLISKGRVIVGLAKGIGSEYFTRNILPKDGREMYYEAVDLMIRAWTEPEPFAHDGKYYQLPCVNIWPNCYQQPHPPIWVPGLHSADTIKWAAGRRYPYLRGLEVHDKIVGNFDMYRQVAEENGYEAGPQHLGLDQHIYIAETDEQAMREAKPHFEYMFGTLLNAQPQHWFPPGNVPPEAYGQAAALTVSQASASIEEMNKAGVLIIGSAETVTERMLEAQERMGFGIFTPNLSYGRMDFADTKRNMELFAHEVMPHMRALDLPC